MSLRFIYGRAGTGKSQFCFNEISEKIKNNEKIYIITPEQFSFTAEKKLMNCISSKAVINAEVLTFNRMAYRILNEVGGATKTNLTSCGKAMLIYNCLIANKKNLKFLGKSDENIDLIGNAITEFKKHGITVTDLKEEIERTEDMYLKLKLEDMYNIYKNFQDTIVENFIDENDVLTILAEKLEKTHEFDNCLIYIDEFAGFTKQEYDIIGKLLKVAKEVSVTVCTDSLQEGNNPDTDVFYSNKLTVAKLQDVAKQNNIKIKGNIFLRDSNRFKNKELEHLEKNLYGTSNKKYNDKVENIRLFLANNQYSEMEFVAKEIIKLVRDKNLRYKDISVITKNIDTYSSLTKAIFSKYNIPVFIDEKKDLSQNILVKYLLSILEIFNKNWSYEAVFNYIKTGFLDIEKDEIFKLENYCIRWGIKANKWYKQDWTFGNFDEASRQQVQRFNELRKMIVEPLLNLKEKMQANKTVEEISKLLYEFLIEMQIDKKLENKINALEKLELVDIANEYATSFGVILNVLDEIVLIFGKEKITFDKYLDILKIGLKNSGLRKNTSSTRPSYNWRYR